MLLTVDGGAARGVWRRGGRAAAIPSTHLSHARPPKAFGIMTTRRFLSIVLLVLASTGTNVTAFTFSLEAAIASSRKVGGGSWAEFSGWLDRSLSNKIDFTEREGAVEYNDGIGPSLAKHSASTSFDISTFGGVRGVGTKRALDAGEVFMVLPCELAMSTNDAFVDDVAGPAVRAMAEDQPNGYHSQAITMIFLMTEALQYDASRWGPYMGMLPPVGPGIMPIMDVYRAGLAIREELAARREKEGGAADDAADDAGNAGDAGDADDVRRREAVAAAYEAVVGTSRSVLGHVQNMHAFWKHTWAGVRAHLVPRLLGGRNATTDELRFFKDLTTWAFDVVKTRSWASHGCDPADPERAHAFEKKLAKGSQSSTALIPLADMLNHGPLGSAYPIGHWTSPRLADDGKENQYGDAPNGKNQIRPANKTAPATFRGFIFRTPKARLAGDQLFDSYDEGGAKRGGNLFCNDRLVTSYGFVNGDEHMRDCYLITVTRQPPFLFAKDGNQTKTMNIVLKNDNLMPKDFIRVAREKMFGSNNDSGFDEECMKPAEKLLSEHAPVTLLVELKAMRMWRKFLKDTLKTKLGEMAVTDAADLDVGFPSGSGSSSSSSSAAGGSRRISISSNEDEGGYPTSLYNYGAMTDLVSSDGYLTKAVRTVAEGELRVVRAAIEETDRRWMQLLIFDEADDDTNGNNAVPVDEFTNDESINYPPVRIKLVGAGKMNEDGKTKQDVDVKITGGKPSAESAADVCAHIDRAGKPDCIAPVTAEINRLRGEQGWLGGIRRFLSGTSHFQTDKEHKANNATHHRCIGMDALTSTLTERG